MCRALKLDPRMIRFSVVKLAQRLGTRGQIAGIEAIQGKVDWMEAESWVSLELDAFMERNQQRRAPGFDLAMLEEEEEEEGEGKEREREKDAMVEGGEVERMGKEDDVTWRKLSSV